jgi:hypothetical protein
MKKFLIASLALMAFVLPSIAQVDHDYNVNDRVPVINNKITKEQVPAAVLKSLKVPFDSKNPQTWSKFPYALKEYGWVYDVGAENLNLDRYDVQIKDNKDNTYEAIYAANGDLVESREMAENISTPPNVIAELSKSQYKDWKVVGNKEIIKFYHDHNNSSVEEHFRVTVEKDGVKRSISFNNQQSNY